MSKIVKYNHVTETKAYAYAYDVLEGNIIASKDVTNACERFMKDISRENDDSFPFYLDLDECARVENIASCFKHTKGFMAGQQIELAPFQSFIVSNICAFRYKDNPSRKRFKTAFLMIGRKNAKSFLSSMLAMMEMASSKDEAECMSVATKKDQAKICLEQCMSLINSNRKVAKKFKINRSEIRMKSNNSTFIALSSDVNTLDGSSPSLAIIDEAFVTKEGVRSAMVSGTGQRLNSLIVMITTSYDVNMANNWCYEEYLITKRINDQTDDLDNDTHFGMIFQLDSEQDLDDFETNIVKANPLAQTSEFLMENLVSAYEKAKTSSSLMRTFKIKHCNLIMDNKSSNGYMSMSAWGDCQRDVIPFSNVPVVMFGIDMSVNVDLCGVTACTYDEYSGKYQLKAHAFLPNSRITELELRDKMPYRQLAEDGHMTLVQGDVIQAKVIYEWIKEFVQQHNIGTYVIGYDPYSSEELMKLFEQDGIQCIAIRQNYSTLSPYVKKFREDIYTSKVEHELNPILNWNMGNVVTVKDAKYNEMFDKIRSVEKIDLVASSLFAYFVANKLHDNYFGRSYDDYVLYY